MWAFCQLGRANLQIEEDDRLQNPKAIANIPKIYFEMVQ
jgi:hypothetical protein